MKLKKCRLCIHSFKPEVATKYLQWVQQAGLGVSGIVLSGIVSFPMSVKKLTVNKSPHVDKKSREQFEIRMYKQCMDIHIQTEKSFETFLNVIKEKPLIGLDIKVVNMYESILVL